MIHLSEKWAIDHDDNQWILKRRARRGSTDAWEDIGYAATKKALTLCIREKRATIDAEGLANLKLLPNSFKDFKQWSDTAGN